MITISEEIVVLNCYEVHRIWNYLRKNCQHSVMDFLRKQFPLWEPVFYQVEKQFQVMDLEDAKSSSNPMNAFEYSAVSSFLSEWPEDLDFPTLIQHLRNEEVIGLTIWQPFENYSGAYIAGCIDDRVIALMDSFKPKTSEMQP